MLFMTDVSSDSKEKKKYTLEDVRKDHVLAQLPDASIQLLLDKGLENDEFKRFKEALALPDQTFSERRKKSRAEKIIERGDAPEITTGRYARYLEKFPEISSEQALVRGRMRFAVEYIIALAGELSTHPEAAALIPRDFSDKEKEDLRNIYKNFRTKDYLLAKILEDKTKHDVVAANTLVTILGQQANIDESLMRGLVHFGRTSADVNSNVTASLYVEAVGLWAESVSRLVTTLKQKAEESKDVTWLGRTHGQDAQLVTLGHVYANLAEQIKQHAGRLLEKERFRLDGKIAGAIGTDVDMRAAFPNFDPTGVYKHVVENEFGLRYVDLGLDQDGSNSSFSELADIVANVNLEIGKTAQDLWLYTSRGLLAKKTNKGESGSSAMPQKANPFLAEGAEALVSLANALNPPIKEQLVKYREQGDLRRSITERERYHAIMLSVIAVERLISEIENYAPHVIGIEKEIAFAGPKVASSAISTYLRGRGVENAYDGIKEVVLKPFVPAQEVVAYVAKLVKNGTISEETGRVVTSMIEETAVGLPKVLELYAPSSSAEKQAELATELAVLNQPAYRQNVLGTATRDTLVMIGNTQDTIEKLARYAKPITTSAK